MTPILADKIVHSVGLALFALTAFFWVFHGLRVAYGALHLPFIKDFAPASNADCPRVSLIFAARDEEEKLPAALVTLAAVDYPHLEIIAVNDRSQDSTGRILDEFARIHESVRVVHVEALPTGWLGKTHALQKGYERSTGDWLLFTDADVRFAPDARVADITALLDTYQASIIDARGGMFRLQFGARAMSKDEIAALMNRLKSEKIVNLAVAAP